MKKIDSIKEMQAVELDMLKRVHSAFEKNSLKYCLAYGTLLGAVRHNGFIPWDDDVDIMMPRPDFEFLRKNSKKIFAGLNLKLAFYDGKDCYYPRPFAKIIDDRTKLIETNYDDGNEIGVFIDVFVLDGTPNNNILCALHRKRCVLLKKIIFASVVDHKKVNNVFSKLLVKIAHILDKDKILDRADRLCKKHDYRKSRFVVNMFSEEDGRLPEQAYRPIKMKFDDLELLVPVDYETILKNRYGNYLQLPPKDQRVPSHPSDVFWK